MNSRLAVANVAKELGACGEIRYLDANQPERLVKSELPPPVRFLALHAVPKNYVFGTTGDKYIFRSPIGSASRLGPRHFADIDWCCGSRNLLLNGPKDEEPVEAIFERRSRSDFEVIFVLTPSLRAGFLASVVIPGADVLVGAWDELHFLTGPAPASLRGAALTAARLREMAPRAEIHITMGKLGVLSMAAGSGEMAHVELDPASNAFDEAQAIAQARPANLCGAGDAFAGGVLASRAFDWSLVTAGDGAGSTVRSALAGCAAALRWIGFRSDLAVGSFLVGRGAAPANVVRPLGFAA